MLWLRIKNVDLLLHLYKQNIDSQAKSIGWTQPCSSHVCVHLHVPQFVRLTLILP